MSQLTDLFAAIANAIRDKAGSTEQIQATQFASAIANIPTGINALTGEFVGNNSKKFTIPSGENTTNIFIVATSNSQSNIATNAILGLTRLSTNAQGRGAYKTQNGANIGQIGCTLSGGVLTIISSDPLFSYGITYRYIAW